MADPVSSALRKLVALATTFAYAFLLIVSLLAILQPAGVAPGDNHSAIVAMGDLDEGADPVHFGGDDLSPPVLAGWAFDFTVADKQLHVGSVCARPRSHGAYPFDATGPPLASV